MEPASLFILLSTALWGQEVADLSDRLPPSARYERRDERRNPNYPSDVEDLLRSVESDARPLSAEMREKMGLW